MRINMTKRSNSKAQEDTIRFLHINGSNPTVEGHLLEQKGRVLSTFIISLVLPFPTNTKHVRKL